MVYPKKIELKKRRSIRTRAKIAGNFSRPRLSVFRSNAHMYAQIIDDLKGVTVASASDLTIEKREKLSPKERAALVGKEIGKRAKEKGVSRVVFDRGGFAYMGLVKILADAAREEGLQF